MNRIALLSLTCLLFAAVGPVQAAFNYGDLVILTTAKNTGTDAQAITLNNYSYNQATGTFSSTPTAHIISGLTLPGEADHDGLLHLSTSQSYLTFGAYQAAAGTPAVIASGSTRAVAVVDSNWNVTTTPITGYAGVALRSVVSTDGQHFWTGGDQGASGGQYYVNASGPVTQIPITPNDARANRIVDDQLWGFSSSNNGTKIGSGLPTAATTATAAMTSPYLKSDAIFLDLNNDGVSETAYSTDGKNLLGKWHFDGSVWTQTGSWAGTKSAINDINSLEAFVFDGKVELLAATQVGQLFKLEDANAINSNFSAAFLANVAPTPFLNLAGVSFRGMAITVPEPATVTLLGLAVPFLMWRRWRVR